MAAARFTSAVFALLAAALIPASSVAEPPSLRDLRAQEAEQRTLDREAAYTSEVCGRPIAASIDWASVKNWPEGASVVEACDGALGAVETVCRAGRKTVVDRFVCAGDGSGPSLSGKTLRYGAAPGGNGYAATLARIGATE